MARLRYEAGSWDEAELYREKDTRLPTQLYPFRMHQERDEDQHLSGPWYVYFKLQGCKDPERLIGSHANIFEAFRIMLDAYEAWFPTKPHPQVYFIGTELKRGKLLKVGYSQDPNARLAALQVAHGERLQIFVTTPGDRNLEEKYHRRWHARRQQGEWFTIGDCVIDEIERLRAPTPTREVSDGR